MAERRADDGMIEIGDPEEEAVTPGPPPRVVIEYRERGVPWMMIPPMLVIVAVLAVVGYLALQVRSGRERDLAAALAVASRPAPVPSALPGTTTSPPSGPTAPPPPPPSPSVPTKSDPGPPEPVGPPSELAPIPPGSGEIVPGFAPDTASPPKVIGLGFDLKALEAEKTPPAPADPAIAPAGQGGQPVGPAPEAGPALGPDRRDQPEEVDPELLPPDPRLARERRSRWLVQARQQVEVDRVRFHSELRALCRKLGPDGGEQIVALCKQYGTDVAPQVKEQARRLLEHSAAGAGVPVRINLLRSLGYPEGAILADIFANGIRHLGKASREGPGSDDAMMYRAALTLLSQPPNRPAAASRPVSAPRTNFNPLSTPGNAAPSSTPNLGPAR